MLFSFKTLLLLVATFVFASLAAAQGVQPQPQCAKGPWNSMQFYGSTGTGSGYSYCYTKWQQGLVITGVEAWADSKQVQAVQFYWSDGTTTGLIGNINKEKDHFRIDWDSKVDGIGQMRIWKTKKGGAIARLYIRTRGGVELDVGIKTDGYTVYEPNVSSGMLLGVWGYAGSQTVNGIGFLFLRSKIDKAYIENIKFDDTPEELNKRMEGLSTVIIDYAEHHNDNQKGNATFVFMKQQDRSTSRKFTLKDSHSIGADQAIKIGGDIIVAGLESTTTLKYLYIHETGSEVSEETKVSITYSVWNLIKPGKKIFCRATAMFGNYKGAYNANMHIFLEDGYEWRYRTRGVMEQVAWSQAVSRCRGDPFPKDDAVPSAPLMKRSDIHELPNSEPVDAMSGLSGIPLIDESVNKRPNTTDVSYIEPVNKRKREEKFIKPPDQFYSQRKRKHIL